MHGTRFSFLARHAGLLAAGGILCQFGSCSLPNVLRGFANLNPCGTILACDPDAFLLATGDPDTPGANFDIDPFCTFPPFCSAAVDPILGGGAP